ncbi:MAG: hypothetical protein GF344_16675 [Chitinivibrionales bacterium]|nr:hypothetical protein [Chitinivibrionales bacterium]MBD3358323.1 hypothetical protein [Chitinivibrionales bacterium]
MEGYDQLTTLDRSPEIDTSTLNLTQYHRGRVQTDSVIEAGDTLRMVTGRYARKR